MELPPIPGHILRCLEYLDSMGISYEYFPKEGWWEFEYDALYLFMPNNSPKDEIRIIAPVVIEGEDEEIKRMVYDWTVDSYLDISENCTISYDRDGWCHIYYTGKVTQPMTKTGFEEVLTQIHQLQDSLTFDCMTTHEFMFNPPSSVMKEVLVNLKIEQDESDTDN